LFGLYNFNI